VSHRSAQDAQENKWPIRAVFIVVGEVEISGESMIKGRNKKASTRMGAPARTSPRAREHALARACLVAAPEPVVEPIAERRGARRGGGVAGDVVRRGRAVRVGSQLDGGLRVHGVVHRVEVGPVAAAQQVAHVGRARLEGGGQGAGRGARGGCGGGGWWGCAVGVCVGFRCGGVETSGRVCGVVRVCVVGCRMQDGGGGGEGGRARGWIAWNRLGARAPASAAAASLGRV
jgi:hypothetical protein